MPGNATASRSSRPPRTRRSSPTSSRTPPGSRQRTEPITAALRTWWLKSRRDLPWRATRDPYAIWISEVLLQQTTVAVGRKRFRDFLERFPGVEQLAGATEDEVLAAWSGLGYYARARNLHRAAREIAARGFPRGAAALGKLPGFGPYTAAAVASIAFGEPVAAVDANVARVICRLARIPGNPRSPLVKARVRRAAGALLERTHPGDHNQALMDLGAAICTPRAPRCGACPLALFCRGKSERYGLAPKKSAVRRIALAAGIALRAGKLVLVPDREMVRGHLTVPLARVAEGEDPAAALARAGLHAVAPLGVVRHAVLDRRYEVHVFRVAGARPPRGAVLAASGDLASIPHGGLLRKVAALVDWPA